MFNISSCIDELRAEGARIGHAAHYHLGTFLGPVVATLEVTSAPIFRASNVAVSVVSGDIDDVRHGFLLEWLSEDLEFKGFWNIRAAGTISATNLPIRELSQADLHVLAGDIILVRAYVPLVDKLPAADATFAPDQIPYTNQNDVLPPIACTSGHFFKKLKAAETVAEFEVNAGRSYVTDSSSAGTRTYVHTVLAGPADFKSGYTSTDIAPIFESGVGESTILTEVTDVTNSATWIQYTYVSITDEDTPPISCVVDGSIYGADMEGWGVPVLTYDFVPRSRLPDGGLVCLYSDEIINDKEQSFGNGDRSHIKVIGYADQDTVIFSPAGELRFNIISPLQRLLSLPGFSKALEHADPALDWQQIEAMTVFRVLLHLPRWFTWFTENWNLVFTDTATNLVYPKFYLPKAPPAEQERELAESVNCRVVCLKWGELQIHTALQYMQQADRLTANAHHLSSADVLIDDDNAPQLVRIHFKKLELLRLTGISAGLTGNVSVYSDYPGKATGRGNTTVTYDKAIVPSTSPQLAANIITGLRGAYEDGVYIDPDTGDDGVFEKAYEWTVSLPGSYNVFDFDQSYIVFDDRLELTGDHPNLRDIDVTRLRHWIRRIEISVDEDGASILTLTLMAETYAPPAETGDPPVIVVLPPYTPPDYIPTPQPPPSSISLLPGETGQLPISGWAVSSHEAKTARASHFDPSSGVIEYDDRSSGLTGLGIWGRSNPFRYNEKWLMTDEGIEICENFDGDGGWVVALANSTLFGDSARRGHELHTSINRRNWGIAACGRNVVAVTFDRWNSVDIVTIDGDSPDYSTTVEADGKCALSVSSNGPGPRVVATTTVGAAKPEFVSEDGGQSWSASIGGTSTALNAHYNLEIPYKKPGGAANSNDDDMLIYNFGKAPGGSGTFHVRRNSLDFSLNEMLWGDFDGVGRVPQHSLIGSACTSFTHDANYWWFIARNQSSGSDMWIGRTTDNWATRQFVLSLAGIGAGLGMINGWAMNRNVAFAFSRAMAGTVRMTPDGVNWFGNKPAGWSGGVAYYEGSLSDYILPVT